MKLHHTLIAALLLTALLVPGLAAAADKKPDDKDLPPLSPELTAILDKVAAAREKVKLLTADIVQTRLVEALDIKETFTGAMKFEMPRMLRLELTDDKTGAKRIYIVNDKYAWIYRVKEKQAERFELADIKKKEEQSENPFQYGLAADIRELRHKYQIELKGDGKIDKRDTVILALIPHKGKAGEAIYSKMEFWIDKKLWLPIRVVQYKSDGEIIETFTLANIEFPSSWPGLIFKEHPFEFDPPGDTDIIKHDLKGAGM